MSAEPAPRPVLPSVALTRAPVAPRWARRWSRVLLLVAVAGGAQVFGGVRFRPSPVASGDAAHVIYAPCMTAAGDVVYNAWEDGPAGMIHSAWLQRADGTLHPIGNPDGFRSFRIVSANDRGQLLGVGYHDSEQGEGMAPKGFVLDLATGGVRFFALGGEYPEYAYTINNLGQVALGSPVAVTLVMEAERRYAVPPATPPNDEGCVLAFEPSHASWLELRTGQRLATVASELFDPSWRINDTGWAAGVQDRVLYLKRILPGEERAPVLLGTDEYTLKAVNNRVSVVGTAVPPGSTARGFAVIEAQFYDLTASTDELGDWVVEDAVAISDQDEILAVAKAGPYGRLTRILRLQPYWVP